MKTIILDFDGTLADTNESIFATVKSTLETLHLPVPPREDITRLIGLPLRENFTIGAGITDQQLADECVRIYREQFDDIADHTVSLFPNVRETLQHLHRQGLRLTIASSRNRESLKWFLRKFDMADCISHVLGEQDVTNKKPAPDMVLRLLELTGTRPEEALVVGDTTYDIEMGQRAGCPTCGVTYGNHSRQQLSAQGATHVIDDFSQLTTIVNP